MNTKYDKGVKDLIQDLVNDDIQVVYSNSDDALVNLSKRIKSGAIKLPAVIFYRNSGMNLYLNEAVQCNLNYEGTNIMNVNIDNIHYLDTMAYMCDIPYTVVLLTNRLEDAYEFAEELVIKMKMYPVVNIEFDIDLKYMHEGVSREFKLNNLKYQCSVEFEGGGSGLSIEDTSDVANNFGETAGLYRMEFEFILRGNVFKFKIRNKLERSIEFELDNN